jgi:hypothetical protein
MDLAAELPPVVFAPFLGFSQGTADNWSAHAPVSSPSYAADLIRRHPHSRR